VYLLDTEEAHRQLGARDWPFRCPVITGFLDRATPVGAGAEIDLSSAGLAVCFAVPRDALAETAAHLLPATDPQATVAVVTHTMTRSLADMAPHVGARQRLIGIHPLFEANSLSLDGQTVYLAGADAPPEVRDVAWLDDAITRAGGIVKLGAPAHHDAVMAYVQGAAHQSLLTFADTVLTSGFDLQNDLWAARTPLFESLFGLAARVLGGGGRAHRRDP
jgi:prephenate dehydrogenase